MPFSLKKIIFSFIVILLIILLIFLVIEGYSSFKQVSEDYRNNSSYMADQRTDSLIYEINSLPRSGSNDISFLRRLSSLNKMVAASGTVEKDLALKDVQSDFLEFMKENTVYYQLRYIDKNGDEIARVDFDGKRYKVYANNELQNKKDRYYFQQALRIKEGEVLISELDLNIENGEVENRGTAKDPVYVPVIRYATPFLVSGELKGIIISNIYADYFLEDVRRLERQGETVFLINNRGDYLSHPDRSKEFAFMFGREDNFKIDYPSAASILENSGNKILENGQHIFYFRYIYPTTENFALYNGSKHILGDNPDDKYFWILVNVLDKNDLKKTIGNLKNNYYMFLIFGGVIIALIIILSFILAFREPELKLKRRLSKE